MCLFFSYLLVVDNGLLNCIFSKNFYFNFFFIQSKRVFLILQCIHSLFLTFSPGFVILYFFKKISSFFSFLCCFSHFSSKQKILCIFLLANRKKFFFLFHFLFYKKNFFFLIYFSLGLFIFIFSPLMQLNGKTRTVVKGAKNFIGRMQRRIISNEMWNMRDAVWL